MGIGVVVMEKLSAVSESQRQHTQHVLTAVSSVVTEKTNSHPREGMLAS